MLFATSCYAACRDIRGEETLFNPFCGSAVVEYQSSSSSSLAKYERRLSTVSIFPSGLVINPCCLHYFFAGNCQLLTYIVVRIFPSKQGLLCRHQQWLLLVLVLQLVLLGKGDTQVQCEKQPHGGETP